MGVNITRREVAYQCMGHVSTVNIGCEERRLRSEQVQTVTVKLKLQDLLIGAVFMSQLS